MTPSEKKPASTRLSVAVPGALTAILFIGAVAFGSTSLRSTDLSPAAQPDAVAAKDEAPAFGATVAAQGRDRFKHDPTPHEPKATEAPAKDAPESAKPEAQKPEAAKLEEQKESTQPKPAPESKKPAPTTKPAPANPTALTLETWAKDTKVKLSWTAFGGEGFEYYKVVRSADTTVTWPASGDDQVVGVIGDANAPWYADKPGCGTAWYYRVFAVRHGEAGYATLAASNVSMVGTACAPAPEPVVVKPLAFNLEVVPGTGIRLSWEPCWNDRFAAYKLVRSKVNADPRFPLNDGAELVAVIGDAGQTVFLDGAVAAGETWTYRVVAVKSGGGGYVPLCETAAMSAAAQ